MRLPAQHAYTRERQSIPNRTVDRDTTSACGHSLAQGSWCALVSLCSQGGAIAQHKHEAGEEALAGVSPARLTTRRLLMASVIIPHFLSILRFLRRPRLLTRLSH